MIPDTITEQKRNPIKAHDYFLNKCRKDYITVEILTRTGEIIEGIIDCYDKDTIIIHNEMTQIMLFKHSICYIAPRNGMRVLLPEIPKQRSILSVNGEELGLQFELYAGNKSHGGKHTHHG